MSDIFLQVEVDRSAFGLENALEAPVGGGYCTFRNLGNATAFYRRAYTRPLRADRIGIPLLPLEAGELRTAPTSKSVTNRGVTTDYSQSWTGVAGKYWFWTEPGQSTILIINWRTK